MKQILRACLITATPGLAEQITVLNEAHLYQDSAFDFMPVQQ